MDSFCDGCALEEILFAAEVRLVFWRLSRRGCTVPEPRVVLQ
jgi:hypothetical protein